MSTAKHQSNAVGLGGGISIVFDQRAEGCETPYWVGRVFQGGVLVGHFKNDGSGDSTCYTTRAQAALEALVDTACPRAKKALGLLAGERADAVVMWAEARAYGKPKCKQSLKQFAEEYVAALTAVLG